MARLRITWADDDGPAINGDKERLDDWPEGAQRLVDIEAAGEGLQQAAGAELPAACLPLAQPQVVAAGKKGASCAVMGRAMSPARPGPGPWHAWSSGARVRAVGRGRPPWRCLSRSARVRAGHVERRAVPTPASGGATPRVPGCWRGSQGSAGAVPRPCSPGWWRKRWRAVSRGTARPRATRLPLHAQPGCRRWTGRSPRERQDESGRLPGRANRTRPLEPRGWSSRRQSPNPRGSRPLAGGLHSLPEAASALGRGAMRRARRRCRRSHVSGGSANQPTAHGRRPDRSGPAQMAPQRGVASGQRWWASRSPCAWTGPTSTRREGR